MEEEVTLCGPLAAEALQHVWPVSRESDGEGVRKDTYYKLIDYAASGDGQQIEMPNHEFPPWHTVSRFSIFIIGFCANPRSIHGKSQFRFGLVDSNARNALGS